MDRAQGVILETPPTACKAKDYFRPQLRGGYGDEQQTSPRLEEFVHVAQSPPHVADRMQYICAEHKIERARFEALLRSRFFEVEYFELDLRKGGQLLHGAGKECRRHIAESIGMQAAF